MNGQLLARWKTRSQRLAGADGTDTEGDLISGGATCDNNPHWTLKVICMATDWRSTLMNAGAWLARQGENLWNWLTFVPCVTSKMSYSKSGIDDRVVIIARVLQYSNYREGGIWQTHASG